DAVMVRDASAVRVVVEQFFVQHDRRGPAAAEDLVAAAVAVEQLPSAPVEEIGKFCRKHGRKNCGTGICLTCQLLSSSVMRAMPILKELKQPRPFSSATQEATVAL